MGYRALGHLAGHSRAEPSHVTVREHDDDVAARAHGVFDGVRCLFGLTECPHEHFQSPVVIDALQRPSLCKVSGPCRASLEDASDALYSLCAAEDDITRFTVQRKPKAAGCL